MMRARAGVGLTVFLLACLASAGASASPLYWAAARDSLIVTAVEAAPAAERVITRTWTPEASESGIVEVDRALPRYRSDFDTVRGVRLEGRTDTLPNAALVYRAAA